MGMRKRGMRTVARNRKRASKTRKRFQRVRKLVGGSQSPAQRADALSKEEEAKKM